MYAYELSVYTELFDFDNSHVLGKFYYLGPDEMLHPLGDAIKKYMQPPVCGMLVYTETSNVKPFFNERPVMSVGLAQYGTAELELNFDAEAGNDLFFDRETSLLTLDRHPANVQAIGRVIEKLDGNTYKIEINMDKIWR